MFLNTTAIIKIQILEIIDTLGGTEEQIFTHFTDELLGCVTSLNVIYTCNSLGPVYTKVLTITIIFKKKFSLIFNRKGGTMF